MHAITHTLAHALPRARTMTAAATATTLRPLLAVHAVMRTVLPFQQAERAASIHVLRVAPASLWQVPAAKCKHSLAIARTRTHTASENLQPTRCTQPYLCCCCITMHSGASQGITQNETYSSGTKHKTQTVTVTAIAITCMPRSSAKGYK